MAGPADVMAKASGKLGTKGMLQKAGCKRQRKDTISQSKVEWLV